MALPPQRAPMQRNASDPGQVRRAQRIERDRALSRSAALRDVLKTPAGRLVFGELLEEAGLYRTSFDASGSVVYFREGRRNFGLEIQAMLLEADPEGFDLLERERRERRRLEETSNAAAHTPAAEQQGENDGR